MKYKKDSLSIGLATGNPGNLPSARRRASQTGSHAAARRRREPGRRWGLHLTRRNGVFYFRRRWPQGLRHFGAPEFLSLSLQTHVLADAVKRSGDLLTALESRERDMMMNLAEAPIDGWRVGALLREMVRSAVAEMMARLEAPVTAQDSARRVQKIAEKRAAVQTAQRARDWSLSPEFAGAAATMTGVPSEALVTPAIGREILSTARRLLDLARDVKEECSDPLHAGRALLDDVGLAPSRSALKSPLLLSEAIEKACTAATPDVETKLRTVGCLARAFFGDVPVATLPYDQIVEFLHFVWNMPKGWGKSHGRNRFEQIGRVLDPRDEQRVADQQDAALVKDILGNNRFSIPEKRRRLVEGLTPRLTDNYLFVQRDMFNRIVRAALGAAATARDLEDEDRVVPSHKQLRAKLVEWHKQARTPCGLPTRVSRPKRRRSWSLEHLVELLLSPIYTGTSSDAQRWRKATASKRVLRRDAIY
ncbi:hypothetical protein KTN05_15085 [Paracoccus sp. Z118]|uniref:DUF6538 domain-containing protein n=1 Tax=Paracoccus sp. Z118 TaxID=2851017 RepID=UPI001C2C6ACB|nr:DUF6538 domain-containing protein [Paracoccus sp. Z118]MBV0893139.1 hypothetical protein [Paracoccus sp. Z118]